MFQFVFISLFLLPFSRVASSPILAYLLVFSRNPKMGDYSSSSLSGATQKQRGNLVCYCGVDSPLVTAWTDENLGRKFYGCGSYFQRKRCKFFRWFDLEVPHRQKKIIRGLLKKNDVLRKKERTHVNIVVILGVLLLLSFVVMCIKFAN